ncbi:hypothetical protein JCM30204_33490 [Dysgonomonas termitidis]
MALSNVFTFIKYIQSNNDFRKSCYSCKSKAELRAILACYEIVFTDEEFREAISASLFKCQMESEPLEIKQIERLFNLYPEK